MDKSFELSAGVIAVPEYCHSSAEGLIVGFGYVPWRSPPAGMPAVTGAAPTIQTEPSHVYMTPLGATHSSPIAGTFGKSSTSPPLRDQHVFLVEGHAVARVR